MYHLTTLPLSVLEDLPYQGAVLKPCEENTLLRAPSTYGSVSPDPLPFPDQEQILTYETPALLQI